MSTSTVYIQLFFPRKKCRFVYTQLLTWHGMWARRQPQNMHKPENWKAFTYNLRATVQENTTEQIQWTEWEEVTLEETFLHPEPVQVRWAGGDFSILWCSSGFLLTQAVWTPEVAFVSHKRAQSSKRKKQSKMGYSSVNRTHSCYIQDWSEQAEHLLPGGPCSLAFFTVRRKKKKKRSLLVILPSYGPVWVTEYQKTSH